MFTFLNRALVLSLSFLLAACAEKEAAPDPVLVEGAALYKQNCKVCHAQGINGAPIVGNKKMWGSRAEQELETLVKHASGGFGLMPAKGGNSELTSEQIESVVLYMLSQLNEPSK